ncbi:hypothetical protein STIUS_v1c02570 [Spiroplasma sp. TIUS-1]|uniref:DUF4293 domain-containing protein n=1 Tax=Spiroplasma sp. TIUS-1 TaxID=216963 RepID=UPI001396E339|nr:DUF4293 domain-containing protein [Spiroplasma sp. TIUS-1]QHX35811.1 hypothetical protein STIUS_v1c02570 [Spiroplasma sp. TIUS-1]
MIVRVEDKTNNLRVSWNTKIEVACRVLIITVTIAILLMSFFVGAGFAKIYDQFYNLIGEIAHEDLKGHYIKMGSIALIIFLPLSILISFPYIFMKNPNTIRIFILISLFIVISYVVSVFSIMLHFEKTYEFTNPYIKASYWVIGIGGLIILVSKVFLWREIKKQFKIKKTFEYLNEEKEFIKISKKQQDIVIKRDQLLKDGIELEDVEQHILDNANEISGNTIKKKHLSSVWEKKAKAKEADNK